MEKSDKLVKIDADLEPLTPPMRLALAVLANGGRLKDAARAAEVTPGRVWNWRRTYLPFRSALETRYAVAHDRAQDVLDAALERAMDAPEEDRERAMANGLKAVGMVQRGLGIGVPLGGANAPTPANVQVTVAVGLLQSHAGATPTVDVPLLDGGASISLENGPTVGETQPRRSRTSSRRKTRSGSSHGV